MLIAYVGIDSLLNKNYETEYANCSCSPRPTMLYYIGKKLRTGP